MFGFDIRVAIIKSKLLSFLKSFLRFYGKIIHVHLREFKS